MGCGASQSAPSGGNSRSIVRLLLLGAGEAGKSTIFKQVRVQKLHGFTEEHRQTTRDLMRSKLLEVMKQLLEGLTVPSEAEEAATAIREVDESEIESAGSSTILQHIVGLWSLEAVVEKLESLKPSFDNSTIRVMENVEAVCGREYLPTDEDILFFRQPTSDIAEIEYHVNDDLTFKFIDIGGQRKERMKWNTITDLTAIIFVVALDEYDKTLVEDTSRNRMKESLLLFRMIATKHFNDLPMILMLNKKDLFLKKIVQKDLNVCFPEYKGGLHYTAAVQFIEEEFRKVAGRGRQGVYVHRTCATETNQMQKVLESVEQVVLELNLSQSGLSVMK